MVIHLLEKTVDERLQEEYERTVLTMVIGGDNFEKKEHILKHLCLEMFNKPIYKTIFKTVKKLQDSGKEIEIGNVCENLKKEEQKKFAIELNEDYITNMNCNYYLEKLLNNYIKKLLINCDSFDGYRKIEEIKRKYSTTSDIKHISYATDELIVEYYNKWGNEVKTYYPQIDNTIGYLQGGDVMILAGATGMGKTCMMLNLVLNMAEKGNKKVLVFSLEMPLKQLQNRLICAKTGVNSDKIRKFTMTNFEQKQYSDYALSNEFNNLPIEVCTEYNITTDKIKDTVLSSEADIVFIDYLGLIKSETQGTIYERTSQVSRDLKLLANEVNKPFIILHQLSRIPNERKEKRPLLSDLRDSGKIEQDADCICFVFREAYYNPSADKSAMEFLIAKSRHTEGKKIIKLHYEADKQLITDKIGEYMLMTEQGKLDV